MAQVLGLCRFSYPSEVGAFANGEATLDAIRAYLYAPERLETRLYFLEHLVLPGLRAQTDPDFSVVLLAGDNLPQPYRARLEALVATVPQIVPVYLPEGENHREICRRVMLAHRDPAERVVLEFRLDDDDAVGVDFVAQTRDRFGKVFGLFKEDGRLCLDFCRGYLMAFGCQEIAVQKVAERMWTPAQVICRRTGDRQSLLESNHLHLWSRMNTVSLQDPPLFIRGGHQDNDSNLLDRPRFAGNWQPLDEADEFGLSERFALDIPALKAGWQRGALLAKG